VSFQGKKSKNHFGQSFKRVKADRKASKASGKPVQKKKDNKKKKKKSKSKEFKKMRKKSFLENSK